MAIQLSDDQTEELSEAIISLMHNWHPRDNASDYCCEFCGNTASSNKGDITHGLYCKGQKFLDMLRS